MSAKTKQQQETLQAVEEIQTAFGLRHETVKVLGQEITVSEFSADQMPEILLIIDEANAKGQKLFNLINPGTNEPVTFESFDWKQALLRSGDGIIKLVMLATGKERGWFKQFGMGPLLQLAMAVFKVNKDFFLELAETTPEMNILLQDFVASVQGVTKKASPSPGGEPLPSYAPVDSV